jgi:aspartyl-tRNA(Asn)/glutamyl-tRNA(Gln) amidotransferase subunit A
MNLLVKTIKEIGTLLSTKAVSAQELVEAHYQHIDQHEQEIGAFLAVTKDLAFAQARRIDALVKAGEALPPLAGVPVALKDNLCVRDEKTTCASKVLADFIPSYEATAVTKLFEAGAICLGKTNMDEFAMGSSTENSAFKLTRNPWDLSYVPGGSSGGSCAAVTAAFSTLALGSDTGGSVRQPASFCGVVGMKPTYGLVSRFGLVAFASSLDQIGPLARTVEDTAKLLAVIAGHDEHDSTSIPDDRPGGANDLRRSLLNWYQTKDLKGMRIGVIEELVGEGNEPEVQAAVVQSAKTLELLGASVENVSVPRAKDALPVYYIIATAEASSNLARYDGVKYGYRDKHAGDLLTMYTDTRQAAFGAEVKRRIMLGTYVLSSGYYDAYYKKAQQVRRLLANDFEKIFQTFDLVICPTSPSVAFKFGDKTEDPLSMYLSDIASIPINLAGLPALSIPAGFGKNGLPIGLQMIGPALGDAKLLKAAFAFEQASEFHKRLPPLLAQLQNR